MALTDKQLAALNDKATVVIIPADGVEAQIARQFLEANAPKTISEDRVFDNLHLLSLQGAIKVCAVYRSNKTPSVRYFRREDGVRESELRPINELMDEMIVTAPVEPKYTREGPMKPLLLDVAGFLAAMGQQLTPMRLDYIDKGEAKPQVMKLSWT